MRSAGQERPGHAREGHPPVARRGSATPPAGSPEQLADLAAAGGQEAGKGHETRRRSGREAPRPRAEFRPLSFTIAPTSQQRKGQLSASDPHSGKVGEMTAN